MRRNGKIDGDQNEEADDELTQGEDDEHALPDWLNGDEDESDDDDEGGDPDEDDDDDPEFTAKVTKAVEAREAALLEALENGDTKHPVYPKWQRVLARKDKQLADQGALIENAVQRLEALDAQMAGSKAGFDWISSTVLDALGDDDRQAAELGAREARLALGENLASRRPAPRPQPQQQEVLPDFVIEGRKKFLEGRQAAAKRAGVDPKDPSLDYGADNEAILVRLEKFEDSLTKAMATKNEKRIANVRQRPGNLPATRASGDKGGKSKPFMPADATTLQRGSAARLRELLTKG